MFSSSGPGGIQTPSIEPASTPKITRGHSCVLCFHRKVKCDGQRPCSTCIKARAECITKASTGPRRRRVQVSRGDLLARLRRCEELLESHGVKIEDEVEAQRPIDQQMVLSPDDAGSPESTVDIGKLIIERGHSRYIENDLWSELGDEVRILGFVTSKFAYLKRSLSFRVPLVACSAYYCAPSVLVDEISGVASVMQPSSIPR